MCIAWAKAGCAMVPEKKGFERMEGWKIGELVGRSSRSKLFDREIEGVEWRKANRLIKGRAMITYKPARDEQYDEFLKLMRRTTDTDYEGVLELMGISWKEFAGSFRTLGKVYGIYEDDDLAGFYWIELRGDVLHLHGLILDEGFQGRGLGTGVLKKIEAEYRDQVRCIESGVDQTNTRAKHLYERMGCQVVKTLEDVRFYIMQKELAPGNS
jgi:ribosomal protein S18 acetylase RimI-like enzyme